MTATVSIHPQAPLEPGRYWLDADGRLHPLRFRFIAAVAVVNVACKQVPAPKAAEKIPLPAPHEKTRVDAPMRPMARKAKPTPVHLPREIKEELDSASSGGGAARRLPSKSERLAVDGKKLAAAIRRNRREPPPPKKAPTRRALGAGPCNRCGIPGFRGCDHFLPFEGHTP